MEDKSRSLGKDGLEHFQLLHWISGGENASTLTVAQADG
jgi:hypothetical protein